MKLKPGRRQDLGDGWVGQFDYALSSRGWAPAELRVWHDGAEMAPGGLPVRRLRQLTTSEDLAALGSTYQAPTRGVPTMTASEQRTLEGRLSALGGYDSLRFMGRTRTECARAMNVSEAWLKWLLSWARSEGYLSPTGDLTEQYVIDMQRTTVKGGING